MQNQDACTSIGKSKTCSLYGVDDDAASAGQPHEPGRPCYLETSTRLDLTGTINANNRLALAFGRQSHFRPSPPGAVQMLVLVLLARHLHVNTVTIGFQIAATTLCYHLIPPACSKLGSLRWEDACPPNLAQPCYTFSGFLSAQHLIAGTCMVYGRRSLRFHWAGVEQNSCG